MFDFLLDIFGSTEKNETRYKIWNMCRNSFAKIVSREFVKKSIIILQLIIENFCGGFYCMKSVNKFP